MHIAKKKNLFLTLFPISRLIPQKQHSRPMMKAQDLVNLTCIILSDREYYQLKSSAKDNPKGHNLLACRTLSNFVLTQHLILIFLSSIA